MVKRGKYPPSPLNAYVLIPRACEYVRLHAKGNNFAERIKAASQLTLNREIVLDYLGWPNNITGF